MLCFVQIMVISFELLEKPERLLKLSGIVADLDHEKPRVKGTIGHLIKGLATELEQIALGIHLNSMSESRSTGSSGGRLSIPPSVLESRSLRRALRRPCNSRELPGLVDGSLH